MPPRPDPAFWRRGVDAHIRDQNAILARIEERLNALGPQAQVPPAEEPAAVPVARENRGRGRPRANRDTNIPQAQEQAAAPEAAQIPNEPVQAQQPPPIPQQPAPPAVNIAPVPAAPVVIPQVGEPVYERFSRQKPPTFEGTYDPAEAEDWLKRIKRIFNYMGLEDHEKVACAVH